jgi:hypothetical protein
MLAVGSAARFRWSSHGLYVFPDVYAVTVAASMLLLAGFFSRPCTAVADNAIKAAQSLNTICATLSSGFPWK